MPFNKVEAYVLLDEKFTLKKKDRPPKMVDHHLFGIFSSFFDLLLIIGILGFQKIIGIYTTPKAIPEKPQK